MDPVYNYGGNFIDVSSVVSISGVHATEYGTKICNIYMKHGATIKIEVFPWHQQAESMKMEAAKRYDDFKNYWAEWVRARESTNASSATGADSDTP